MRYFILPAINGNTLANMGFTVFDADKFGTGIMAAVADAETEQEAKDFITAQGGELVDPPKSRWETETETVIDPERRHTVRTGNRLDRPPVDIQVGFLFNEKLPDPQN